MGEREGDITGQRLGDDDGRRGARIADANTKTRMAV